MVWHIIERFFTHLLMGASLVLMWAFLIDFANRKRNWPLLPKTLEAIVVLSAIISLPFIFMREPFDIGVVGDWWGKSYFDFVSWFLGLGLSAWGLIRLIRRAKREALQL